MYGYENMDLDELTREEIYLANHRAEKGSAKKMRELHKELKKFGWGISIVYRYPNLPLIISIIALAGVAVKIVLLYIH